MSLYRPVLPQEILDMIIESVSCFRIAKHRTAGLSSIALVSRSFRERAHGYLFAAVKLPDLNKHHRTSAEKQGKKRIREFYELSEANPRLTSRITYLAVQLEDSCQETAARVAKIFSQVFACPQDASHPRPCSLWLDARHQSLYAFGEEFGRRFFEIVQNPRLTHLYLRNLYGLPNDLLRGSSIKHLEALNLSLSWMSKPRSALAGAYSGVPSVKCRNGRVIHCDVAVLDSLTISSTFPVTFFLDMSRHQSVAPEHLFSKLKYLEITEDLVVYNAHIWRLLENKAFGPGLATVKLEALYIRPDIGIYPESLYPIHLLSNLTTLILSYGVVTKPDSTNLTFTAFRKLLSQDQGLPSKLRNIILQFSLSALDLVEMIPSYKWWRLDELFSERRFGRLDSLTLEVCVDLATDDTVVSQLDKWSCKGYDAKEVATYLKGQFPLVMGEAKFEFDVSFEGDVVLVFEPPPKLEY
ncbi:hypothetical protein CPC08DRAFT_708321, partial [Agrocybe pediades]